MSNEGAEFGSAEEAFVCRLLVRSLCNVTHFETRTMELVKKAFLDVRINNRHITRAQTEWKKPETRQAKKKIFKVP